MTHNPAIPAHPAEHVMRCMEVWGGNQPADSALRLAGLDAWVYSRPYQGQSGGGDVHYVSSCATGRIVRLLVADASGHGEAVAHAGAALRTLMERYINFVDQSRLVRALNREFAALAENGSFATAVVATFLGPTSHLVICNAGHPRPLLFDARARRWRVLEGPPVRGGDERRLVNLPLGVAEPTGYEQFGVRLARGDMALLYTDALLEARNARGEMLGEAGLLRLLGSLDPDRPDGIVPSLILKVTDFAAGILPADDATALLIRHNGSRPPHQFVRGLLAPGRIAAAAMRRALRGEPPVPAIPQLTIANLLGPFIPAANKRLR